MRNEKLITAREQREWTQEKAAVQRILSLRHHLQPWSAIQDVKEVDERLRRINRGLSREEGS